MGKKKNNKLAKNKGTLGSRSKELEEQNSSNNIKEGGYNEKPSEESTLNQEGEDEMVILKKQLEDINKRIQVCAEKPREKITCSFQKGSEHHKVFDEMYKWVSMVKKRMLNDKGTTLTFDAPVIIDRRNWQS